MIKVFELSGVELDYWVGVCVYGDWEDAPLHYRPSADWADCGPLIPRFRILLTRLSGVDGMPFAALVCGGDHVFPYSGPDNILPAICRAVVASIMGEPVNDKFFGNVIPDSGNLEPSIRPLKDGI